MVMRSTPHRVVQVRPLAVDILLCSWARPLNSHSASLHTGLPMGNDKL